MNNSELREHLKWLIRLRWLACAGVFVAAHSLRGIFKLDFPIFPVYIILVPVVAYNLYFQNRLRLPSENLFGDAVLQIGLDYIALSAAIYFSGSCDSPFLYYYIFHVVITGIILPKKWAYRFTAFAVILQSTVLGLKHIGLLPHFGIFKDRPVFFAGIEVISIYGTVFISTLILTAYFVTYLSDKLFRKQEEIKRLYIAQSNFIANLSHEIKTPLNAVRGFAALLYTSYSTAAEERELCRKRIDEAIEHINALLNEIMELSKIETGNIKLSIKPFRISDAIHDTVGMLYLKARDKNIDISLETEDIKDTYCCGDEMRFREIIINLLENAIKYTPDGGKAGIKAGEINDSVEVIVWDTGKGIAPEHHESIFNAYEQLQSERMKKIEGTGLGLSIVKKLVEMHGGVIHVESEPGKGSRDSFLLCL
jgi:signal transduction histidine kinase